jgi:hypothetical protein
MAATEHLSEKQFGHSDNYDKPHVKPEVQARIDQVMDMGEDEDALPPF